jgi:hypothetical protein
MGRFWAIRHDHNDLYVAPDRHKRLWVSDERQAKRFDSEDAAVNEIIRTFCGKGRAIQVIMPIAAAAELEAA